MKFTLLPKLVAFLVLTSCGNYTVQKSLPADETVDRSAASLSFDSVNAAIFAPHCSECHQQYSSYSGVAPQLSSILSAINSNQMPKNAAPLSDGAKALLQAWVAAGAPEQPGGPPHQMAPPPLAANWDSISQNIIFPRCIVCHNPTGQAKFLDLSNRLVIFQSRNRIFPAAAGAKLIDLDQPANSYLLSVIEDPVEPMPPISSNIPRLSPIQIMTLTTWFALGLP